MPTYDYHCEACGHEFEAFQSMRDSHLTDCPSCAETRVKRRIGLGAGIIFKGSGFYETDFKDKKGTADATASTTKGAETSEKSKETKTESKNAESSKAATSTVTTTTTTE